MSFKDLNASLACYEQGEDLEQGTLLSEPLFSHL